MFTKPKNIDTAFRHIKVFSILFLFACLAISIVVCYSGYQLASTSQERIYILANRKALEAYAADRKDNNFATISERISC